VIVRSYLVFILFAALSTVAKADDSFLQSLGLSLEELRNVKVAAATKTAESSSLSPAIISLVTAQDIETYGYASVADALSHTAGDGRNSIINNHGENAPGGYRSCDSPCRVNSGSAGHHQSWWCYDDAFSQKYGGRVFRTGRQNALQSKG
jgi:hypothetical protein